MRDNDQQAHHAARDARWTIDEPICQFTFSGLSYPIRLRAHVAEEPYVSHTPAREFVPLTVGAGLRSKFVAQPYCSDAHLTLSLGLRHDRVGDAEAYYYHEDRIILLWRCRVDERLRTANPESDDNLRALWVAFEHFLLDRFPQATQLLTPSWNRPYDEAQWQWFIHARGYTRPSPAGIPNAAFIKDVSQPS